MKVGHRMCDINLWHTEVYYSDTYRLGQKVDEDKWQAGGTNVEDALRKILEKDPDLSIILTDGCFSDVDVEHWLRPNEHFPQVLWIISRDGTYEHPLIRLGATIQIPSSAIKTS